MELPPYIIVAGAVLYRNEANPFKVKALSRDRGLNELEFQKLDMEANVELSGKLLSNVPEEDLVLDAPGIMGIALSPAQQLLADEWELDAMAEIMLLEEEKKRESGLPEWVINMF